MIVKYTSAVTLNISISISLQNSTWFWRKSRWWLLVAMSLTSSQLDQPRAHSRATFNEKSNFKYLFPNEGDPSQWCKAIILNLLLINACDPHVQEEKQLRKSLVCARCNYFCTQGYDFKKRIRRKPICLHTYNFLSTHVLAPYFPIQEKSYSVVPRVTISAQNLINLKSHTLTQSWEKPFIYRVQVLLHKTRKPQEKHAFTFRQKLHLPPVQLFLHKSYQP